MAKTWIDRVKASMKRQRITQVELAEIRLRMNQPWLSMKLAGKTRATVEDITLIAQGLNESVSYIMTGHHPAADVKADAPVVPVIDWEDVNLWPGNRDDVDVMSWVYPRNPHELSPDTFGVTHLGDTMVSPGGGQSIVSGSMLIVDPRIEPTRDCFVIVIIRSLPSLKKLESDGVTTLFRSLNPAYPPIQQSSRTKIVGVVNEASITLYSRNNPR